MRTDIYSLGDCLISIGMVYNLKRSIQIAGWNIDGLYKKINKSRINKLSCSDISSKLVDNDIVLLIETHCSDKDMVSFEGYTAHNHMSLSLRFF